MKIKSQITNPTVDTCRGGVLITKNNKKALT
nr:MAG TPA: hypothetical protein [Caudoviricetes sp.]